ncbi:MAG: hypothetical protein L3J14_03070 [Flavobacteriaceae bacterium]|nr:hypothetical protein [Flavobacteriaceae bacterium]
MNKLFISISLISIFSFSQENIQKDTIYMDENQIEITKEIYLKKLNNATLYSRNYETKDFIIYKNLYKYYFGSVSSKEYNQIRMLLEKDGNTKIKNGASILIKYVDTLYGFNMLMKRRTAHIKKGHLTNNETDTLKNIKHLLFNYKIYLKDIKKYSKKAKKCSEKLYKKRNTSALHVYKYGKGYSFNENLKWIKDRVLKKMFFKNMYENNLLIIKPNGDYFMKSGHFSDANLNKLLKEENWNQYKKDWRKSLKINSNKGFGIIEKFSFQNHYHTSHCY